MEVTAVGVAVIILSALSVFLGRLTGAVLLGATIPLSASAAITLGWAGGATVLCVIIAATAVIGRAALESAAGALNRATFHTGIAEVMLIAFVFVAIIGGYALPRLFTGATEIYAMDRTFVGAPPGASRFPLTPLAPHAGNITQSFYLIVSAVLCLSVASLSRRDKRFAQVVLWAATLSHSVFALVDLASLGLLEHFRTATYAIAPNQSVAGFTRLIGGATEPSFFGGISVALCAWHLWRHRFFGGMVHLVTGGGMAIFAVLSLSSTAVAVLSCIISIYGLTRLISSRSISAFSGAFVLAALVFAAASWLVLGPLAPMLKAAYDALFLDKLASESGVERSAWARQTLVNLWDTSGLGAGLGASRANGWAMAVLGQTGLPGAVLATGFLFTAFAKRLPPEGAALRAGALALLASAMLSASRVDLGPLFFSLTGCAMAVRSVRGPRQVILVKASDALNPV